MKKCLTLLALLAALQSFSQVGVIYDPTGSNFVRPYALVRLPGRASNDSAGVLPVIGFGVNSLGNFSVQFGGEFYRTMPRGEKLLIGLGIEVMGYGAVYKQFLPSLRVGLERNRHSVALTNNFSFRSVQLQRVKGYEPVWQIGMGLFYKL